jgi:hypothetical protein
MTAVEALLHVRMFELAALIACFFWIAWSPVSKLRTARLWVFLGFLVINLTAIVVAVGWGKVTLW